MQTHHAVLGMGKLSLHKVLFMGIRNKLFIAFLGLQVLLIVIASAIYYAAFERSLDSYLDGRQSEQVLRLAEHLAEQFEAHQDWSFIRDDYRQLRRLYWLAGDQQRSGRSGSPQRLRLLDLDDQPIVGREQSLAPDRRLAIQWHDQPLGWLMVADQSALRDQIDKQFEAQQRRAMVLILLGSAVVAAIMAWVMARHLVLPIVSLTQHSRALRDGNYDTLVDSNRRDELGILSRDLNQLALRLADSQQARQRGLSDLAHELRTPLTVLRGELEALIDGIRPLSQQALERLQQDVTQLSRLIDDLHDLATADAGNLRYSFAPLPLAELIDQVASRYLAQLDAQQQRVELDLDHRLTINGDATRLRQMLDNLLLNSAKYTDPGGQIRIHWQRDSQGGCLVIEDSAPGVPDAALGKLFDPLYRVESSRNRTTGGSGLGLAITQRIINAHGGSIDAHHSPMGGLRITVHLPLLSNETTP